MNQEERDKILMNDSLENISMHLHERFSNNHCIVLVLNFLVLLIFSTIGLHL